VCASAMSEAFDADDQYLLRIIVNCSSSLSLLGCAFIITSYILFDELRQYHLRLIFYLTIADAGSSIVGIVGSNTSHDSEDLICKLVGGSIQFFYLASLLLTSCIAHTLYRVIRQDDKYVERFEKYYVLLCLSVPAGIVIYLALTAKFGDAGLWCWIDGSYGIYRLILFYLPLCLVILYNAITYVLVSYKLYKERKNYTLLSEKRSSTIETTFRWFLLALVFCWMFAIFNRVQNYFQPTEPSLTLYVLHGTFTPLQGFCNSVIYGLNDELRYNYRLLFHRLKCTCCGGDELMLQEEERWRNYYIDTISEYDADHT